MSRFFSVVLSLVLLLGGGLNCHAESAAEKQEDFTIRPGIGVGDLRLGMNKKQLEAILGNHDGEYSLPGGIKAEYSEWKEPGYVSTIRVLFDATGKVIQLSCEQSPSTPVGKEPKAVTADGIHLGSDFAQVTKSYRDLSCTKYKTKDGCFSYYDDKKRGIGFEFSAVKSGGAANQRLCSIIVHQAGKAIIASGEEHQSQSGK